MIVQFLIDGAIALLTQLFGLLPVVSLPAPISDAVSYFAAATQLLSPIVPFDALMSALLFVFAFEAAYLAFKIIVFTWRQTPIPK